MTFTAVVEPSNQSLKFDLFTLLLCSKPNRRSTERLDRPREPNPVTSSSHVHSPDQTRQLVYKFISLTCFSSSFQFKLVGFYEVRYYIWRAEEVTRVEGTDEDMPLMTVKKKIKLFIRRWTTYIQHPLVLNRKTQMAVSHTLHFPSFKETQNKNISWKKTCHYQWFEKAAVEQELSVSSWLRKKSAFITEKSKIYIYI